MKTVLDIYNNQLIEPERLVYPTDDVVLASFEKRLHDLKHDNKFVGLIDGAYDVPTENHVWSLRDCRYAMARARFGDKLLNASLPEQQAMIASDELVLIATVDADDRVSAKKSYKNDKGNMPRPVYPWCQRARRVAGMMIPDGHGGYRPVVDIVTVDGDRGHRGTFMESHLTLGKYLDANDVLGVWLLYEWHEWYGRVLQITDKYTKMGVVTKDHTSSTSIINNIRGCDS
ncbi:hypothetical protein CR970_03440 [Candidatus Saccharibacteria bacterium]|nr:MAG: hypothetical protein CR970_03440 [Candidatus Saccharibacteria bacterium]